MMEGFKIAMGMHLYQMFMATVVLAVTGFVWVVIWFLERMKK